MSVRKEVSKRPAGTTGILAAALVIILGKVGVDLTADEAVILVAAAAGVVSWLSPRLGLEA